MLETRAKYDVLPALAAAGIKPSNTAGFTPAAFSEAMRAAYGGSAVVTCDSQGYVSGAVVCVAKNLTAISCPRNVNTGTCAGTIYLPSAPVAATQEQPAMLRLRGSA